MLIKACLNGGTTREQHPAVPRTPDELAAAAQEAVRAGAAAVHLHPRDSSGAETLEPEAVFAAVRAVRAAVPGVPVGVTTGLWAVDGDAMRRMGLVTHWVGADRPDFASVNLSEPGPDALASALNGAGIEVEAGVWTAEDAERLATSEFGTKVIRILVEPRDDAPEDAVATAAAVDEVLDRHGLDAPRVHHGYGMATWAVVEAALRSGRDIRVGLEDTTVLPDGRPAAGNGDLVAAAVQLAAQAGRSPSTAAGTGAETA
jgi:uncharacterized protein (DUF849 family)